MHSLEISILKTVTYFDVFSYPLKIKEIIFFLDQPASEQETSAALEHLAKIKHIYRFNNFYAVRNDESLVLRRMHGNNLAATHIKRARTVAKFLSWLPYIKAIAVSGSLSKNYADDNSDLDFFIITTANRLWIVRILYSILFKIASVAGIKNWFCLNYFIDELGLEIKEHNLFTAVEATTLMPLKGGDVFKDFFQANNNWIYQYLPNYKPNYKYLKDASPVIPKRITERLINFMGGNKLNDKLHAFFQKRFERMTVENKLSEKGLTIGAYEADKHACKPLPQYFQPKILLVFQERFAIISDNYAGETINKEALYTTK